MKLLTDAIKKALPPLYSSEDTPLEDKQVVVRFFNPMGSESWEIYEGSYQEGMDTWLFFGMCDLAMGSPELGYVTLAELESIRLPMGLGIERDICSGKQEYHPEWATMEA